MFVAILNNTVQICLCLSISLSLSFYLLFDLAYSCKLGVLHNKIDVDVSALTTSVPHLVSELLAVISLQQNSCSVSFEDPEFKVSS